MIVIDTEKCIGCRKCAEVCFPNNIGFRKKKATLRGVSCMECGHCLAVCPVEAISMTEADLTEIVEAKEVVSAIDPEVYLNHLKLRRSIRKFTEEPVSEKELKQILDAGRFSPTGGNLQNVSYYISQKHCLELREMIYEKLKSMGEEANRSGKKDSWYSDFWIWMYSEFKTCGKDRLFFDAGTVIFISSNSAQSALIAAAHMETMIYSLGLGMLYSGFSARAIEQSEELQAYLHLKDGYKVYAALIVGYPDVAYKRSVPRKAADVLWD